MAIYTVGSHEYLFIHTIYGVCIYIPYLPFIPCPPFPLGSIYLSSMFKSLVGIWNLQPCSYFPFTCSWPWSSSHLAENHWMVFQDLATCLYKNLYWKASSRAWPFSYGPKFFETYDKLSFFESMIWHFHCFLILLKIMLLNFLCSFVFWCSQNVSVENSRDKTPSCHHLMDLNFNAGFTLDYLHLHWHKS